MENNIGKLNAIFMQNVENILKKKDGYKTLKEYVSLFTNNKKLLKEYMVFNYIDSISDTNDIKERINECISHLDGINRDSLNKLNEMVKSFLVKNKIEQIQDIENDKLYESINNLIFTKKNIKTINERVENINNINNILIERNNKHHIDNDKSELPLIEDVDLFLKIAVNNFNKKYGDLLTEEEKGVFKTITSLTNDSDREIMLKQEINECLSLTNKYLSEPIDNLTREKLLNVKEKLLEQTFVSDTYIEDVISLIELKQTLSN